MSNCYKQNKNGDKGSNPYGFHCALALKVKVMILALHIQKMKGEGPHYKKLRYRLPKILFVSLVPLGL